MTPDHLDRPNDRYRTASLLVGPVVLLIAYLWHPFIPNLLDKAAVADAVEADHLRWFFSHLLTALGAALLLIAFLAAQNHIRDTAGGSRWVARSIPLLVVGSVLFGMLPAMEIGVLAAATSGADTFAVQSSLDTWFLPILLASNVFFLAGTIAFSTGLTRSRVLSRTPARAVAVALVVMALGRFAPSVASLILSGAAGVLAFVVLAQGVKTPQPQARGRVRDPAVS